MCFYSLSNVLLLSCAQYLSGPLRTQAGVQYKQVKIEEVNQYLCVIKWQNYVHYAALLCFLSHWDSFHKLHPQRRDKQLSLGSFLYVRGNQQTACYEHGYCKLLKLCPDCGKRFHEHLSNELENSSEALHPVIQLHSSGTLPLGLDLEIFQPPSSPANGDQGYLPNSISILPCVNHGESLAAALRALTGEPFDKEDPHWVGELMDLQSDRAKHWHGGSCNFI